VVEEMIGLAAHGLTLLLFFVFAGALVLYLLVTAAYEILTRPKGRRWHRRPWWRGDV
jgi:hypothetical protein